LPIATGIVRRIAVPVQINPEQQPALARAVRKNGSEVSQRISCSQKRQKRRRPSPGFGFESENGMSTLLPIAWTIGLSLLLQVPPLATGPPFSVELKTARRAIEEREAKALEGLTVSLSGAGMAQARSDLRSLLPRTRPRDGASRVTPLPEVVSPHDRGLASVSSGTGKPAEKGPTQPWSTKLQQIRFKAAAELFDLAKRAAAAEPPEYAHAALDLREVLERQPDHPEARRLLGYVPYEGGWARPFAVNQLKKGNVNHRTFGWVPADWVPHLDRGELPAYSTVGQKQVRWLPVQEADRLRSDWKNPWQIITEHFEIQSDVPLGETIEFARRLEAFYDVFFTLFADLVGENLPLARRFHSAALKGETSYRPHQVFYFATRDEFVGYLKPLGADVDESLGYYNPPKSGKGNRAPAYFFRDVDGQLPVTATLYHEVSHQLLFETAGPNAYKKNIGNYWVFEGLGTYFETVTPQSDGSLEVGGLVGERLAAARQSLFDGKFLPLEQFIRLDQASFFRPERVHVNYQQAMALAVFLLQWKNGAYRDAFLDFVRDAYRGRIKRSTGRSLEDRLGEPLRVIGTQFRDFLAHADIGH